MSDVKRFDPPKGWKPPVPPTDPDEEELLEEAFGKPDDRGIYAPREEA